MAQLKSFLWWKRDSLKKDQLFIKFSTSGLNGLHQVDVEILPVERLSLNYWIVNFIFSFLKFYQILWYG